MSKTSKEYASDFINNLIKNGCEGGLELGYNTLIATIDVFPRKIMSSRDKGIAEDKAIFDKFYAAHPGVDKEEIDTFIDIMSHTNHCHCNNGSEASNHGLIGEADSAAV